MKTRFYILAAIILIIAFGLQALYNFLRYGAVKRGGFVVSKDIKIPMDTYALIVGGTSGIGLETARQLLQGGAKVIVVGRKEPSNLLKSFPGKVEFIPSDLSLQKNALSVANSIKDVAALDVVLFSQGTIDGAQRVETSEGLELGFSINYLSRYTILKRLYEKGLGSRKDVRFLNLATGGAAMDGNVDDPNSKKSYSPMAAHGCTIAYNDALVQMHVKTNPRVKVYSLSPGLVDTEIRVVAFGANPLLNVLETVIKAVFPSTKQYVSETVLPIMFDPKLSSFTGLIFNQAGSEMELPPWIKTAGNVEKTRIMSEEQSNAAISI